MTASNARNVCKKKKKNCDMQSVSQLKQICYRTKFWSVTTDWDSEREYVAKCQYTTCSGLSYVIPFILFLLNFFS